MESINDIKFNAPRAFQVQERAVTANDYKILLQKEYPQVQKRASIWRRATYTTLLAMVKLS